MDKDTEKILENASELGSLIMGTDVYSDYRQKLDTLDKDREARDLFDQFLQIFKGIVSRQEGGDIIEQHVLDNLQEVSDRVMETEVIVEYLKAEKKYLELLESIQKELVSENDITGIMD
jgi:cell fate (sporulation/competence/biofilm development) regulator YlbF (YheA/YmcA/DUF963 family)